MGEVMKLILTLKKRGAVKLKGSLKILSKWSDPKEQEEELSDVL